VPLPLQTQPPSSQLQRQFPQLHQAVDERTVMHTAAAAASYKLAARP